MPKKLTLPGAKKTLLFICDNPDVCEPLEMLFNMSGYKVDTRADFVTGVSRAILIEPDFVIVDLTLRDGRAFEVTTFLRIMPEFKLTPIVALCVDSTDEFHEEILKRGFSRYFCKPIKFEKIDQYLNSFG